MNNEYITKNYASKFFVYNAQFDAVLNIMYIIVPFEDVRKEISLYTNNKFIASLSFRNYHFVFSNIDMKYTRLTYEL